MPKLTLSELQAFFQQSIVDKNPSTALLPVLTEKPPISIRERMEIYLDAYEQRLSESLTDDFPQLEKELGSELFISLVQKFIHEHPSQEPNLAEYSAGFPAYVSKIHPLQAKAAWSDWLKILSSQAPEPKDALSLSDLQSGCAYRLRVHPATKTTMVSSAYLLAYRSGGSDGDAQWAEITKTEAELLALFSSPKNLSELEAELSLLKLEADTLAKIITQFIQKNILYCCP